MQVKKIIVGVAAVGLLTAIAGSTMAAQPGAYVGGQAGYGNAHQQVGNDDAKGLAGRLFAGYQFNNNFGAELGWTKLHTADGKTAVTPALNLTSPTLLPLSSPKGLLDIQGAPVGFSGKTTLKTDVVDLVGKASYPVAENINVYGKLGGAYVIQRSNFSGTTTGASGVKTFNQDSTAKSLLPTAGVGVSYDFTSNVSADVSYSRIQKVGSSKIADSIDFVGAGLTYNFG